MAEVDGGSKAPLSLDWSKLLPDSDDQPAELVVRGSQDRSNVGCSAPVDSDQSLLSDIQIMADHKLAESIASKTKTLQNLRSKLPDNGARLGRTLELLLQEQDRRKLLRGTDEGRKDVDECMRNPSSRSRDLSGTCVGSREEAPSFTEIFSQCLKENNPRRIVDVDKAPISLNQGERCKRKSKRKLSPMGRRKPSPSSRQKPFRSPRLVSLERKNGDQKGRASLRSNSYRSPISVHPMERKDDSHVLSLDGSKPKKERTVVLDGEDECQLLETAEQTGEIAECMKETKIYYPSRDDQDSVEICSTDIQCLKPECYMTSPIMNFYILYVQLQASISSRRISDYLFFNTFFYKKLQEAVSHKEKAKDACFAKFRRWWKGVNIFQKAYVLIPIHDDLHWSLAIICIPDKEDGSGPILLHLDSLQLHRSKYIFDNLRRFLIEEWNHLKQEGTPSDLLIEEVWEILPRQISEKKIMVPQQKNDYDCGLFVLYFMERFIEEAPERLKKKDLAMFGKQWFRPEEASSLRLKIRKLLLEEFERAVGDRDTPISSSDSKGSTSQSPETIGD